MIIEHIFCKDCIYFDMTNPRGLNGICTITKLHRYADNPACFSHETKVYTDTDSIKCLINECKEHKCKECCFNVNTYGCYFEKSPYKWDMEEIQMRLNKKYGNEKDLADM